MDHDWAINRAMEGLEPYARRLAGLATRDAAVLAIGRQLTIERVFGILTSPPPEAARKVPGCTKETSAAAKS
jgi:hypothetical protein